MTRVSILVALLALMGVALGAADASADNAVTAAPDRPVPLTAAQFDALKAIEREPTHRLCRDVPASYSQKAAKLEADMTHYGFLGGLPTTMLIVLIAAAPL